MQNLLGLNLPVDHQDTAEGQESIKAKLNAVRNKLVRQVSESDPRLLSEARPSVDVALATFTVDSGMVMMRLRTLLTVGFSHRVPVTPSCTRLLTPSPALSRHWERNLQLFTSPTVTNTATTRQNRYQHLILNTMDKILHFKVHSSSSADRALKHRSVNALPTNSPFYSMQL